MARLLCGQVAVLCVALAPVAGEATGGLPPAASVAGPHGPGGAESHGELFRAISRGLDAEAAEGLRLSAERELPEIRAALRPVLAALPASAEGRLGPTAVRYALHRLFMQRRGWLLKGLDPQGQAWNGTSPSSAAVFAGLPSEARRAIAVGLAGPGLRPDGVATLAVLLEHRVHEKDAERLRSVYEMVGLPTTGASEVEAATYAIMLYAASYTLGLSPATTSLSELKGNYTSVGEVYPHWRSVQVPLLAAVRAEARGGSLEFEGAERVARQMTDEFFRWQGPACAAMKSMLVGMEDRGSGRVRLADFYSKALHEGKWQFGESVPYLRQLGALDETNPRNPRVVIPNYVHGASNCLKTTDSLSVCCVSECEGILGGLERGLGAPQAHPAAVAEQVAALASSTVPAGRSLSSVMQHRLNAIAAQHGGQVPLHGRLFAQWLHHAYPRECPYPHLAGRTRPLHVDDWARVPGQEVVASPSAMAEHAGAEPSAAPRQRGPLESAAWSYQEELFVPGSAEAPTGLLALHGTVHAAAVAVLAFGLVLVRMARAGRKAAQAAKAAEPKLYEV